MYSWISKKIIVKKNSRIGTGTFALQQIKKGEILIVQSGRILHYLTLDENPELEKYWYHGFQIEKDYYIYPISNDDSLLDGLFNVNHSCDANCGILGQVTLVSMRDIDVGEEITFDYVMTDYNPGDWEKMKCTCGSEKCRGIITGDDWKLKELQEKYKGYFSNYLQREINNLQK